MLANRLMTENCLKNDPSIYDCCLLDRTNQNGEMRSTLYFIPNGHYSLNSLQTLLQKALPDITRPDYWIAINNLPYTENGELDEDALARLPVIDKKFLQELNQSLKPDGGVAISGPPGTYCESFYLDDLLPKNNISLPNSNGTLPVQSKNKKDVKKNFSLSNGGDLQIPPHSPTTLQESLQRAANSHLSAKLLFLEQGIESNLSYTKLYNQALRILCGLQHLGLQPGAAIIFQFRTNSDFLCAFWGCILGGFIPVPLACPASYQGEGASTKTLLDVMQMFSINGESTILSTSNIIAEISSLLTSVGDRNTANLLDLDTLVNNEPSPSIYQANTSDIALIMLTSGSTGAPKGVPLTHYNLICRSLASIQINSFSKDTISLNWMPFDHVAGIIYFHLRDVYLCCKQIHVSTNDILQKPLLWLDLLEKYAVSVSFAPNFAFGLICGLGEDISQKQWNLSSVKLILNGGEAIVASTARQFLRLLKPNNLSEHAMCPAWGMSETTSGITYAHSFGLDNSSDSDKYVAVGPPIPGNSMRIVNKHNQLVPEGTTGSLQVKGNTIFNGYYKNENLNSKSFTKDGWFITGDLGRIDSGNITITGREKDVIIINGINYPGPSIEHIVEEIRGITPSYVAACAVADSRQHGKECLAIFFVAEIESQADFQLLLKNIRGEVVSKAGVSPEYLIPLTTLEIPKTSIGKIQRSKLKSAFEAGSYAAQIKVADMISGTHCIPNWFFQKKWQRFKSHPLETNLTNETVLLLADENAFNHQLILQIEKLGANCQLVTAGSYFDTPNNATWQIRINNKTDYQSVIHQLSSEGQAVKNIICMWPCSHYWDSYSEENISPKIVDMSLSVITCSQAIASISDSSKQRRLVIITERAQAVLNNEKVNFFQSPITAVVKTLQQETEDIECLHIDLELSHQSAILSITDALLSHSATLETAWRNGQHLRPALHLAELQKTDRDVLVSEQKTCYLITGGLGGIGIKLANYLLRSEKVHLILTGRSKLIEPEMAAKRERLNELSRLPGTVDYLAIDVSDSEPLLNSVASICSKLNRPLTGVFHLAGNYHEDFLKNETAPSLSEIFHPKISACQSLSNLIKHYPQAFLVNFSSVASLFGGAMVGAYAAANQFMDMFSINLARQGYRCFSLNWSSWQSTGMNKNNTAEAALRAKGILQLDIEQALTSLHIILNQQKTEQFIIGLDVDSIAIQRHIPKALPLTQTHIFYEKNNSSPELSNLKDMFGSPVTLITHQLEHLPRISNGDIDHLALDLLASQGDTHIIPAKTATEQTLVNIWKNILSIDALSIDWNFFDIGGQSILATRLISAIRAEFQISWSLKDIFVATTCETQAILIDKMVTSDGLVDLSIPSCSREGILPLSSSQQRLWFLAQIESTLSAYNVTASIRFENSPDTKFVANCLNTIIARHESLRTIFPKENGIPQQEIKATFPLALKQISLTSEQSIADFLISAGKNKFNLETGPLISATIVETSDAESILSLTLHHIISDGWSIRALFDEFSALYAGASITDLPLLSIQYTDYSIWQQSRFEAGAFDSQMEYWENQLKSGLSGFILPTDFPRPQIQTYHGSRFTNRIPTVLSGKTKDLAMEEGVTLFVLLLAAFKALLFRYSQRNDIIVGTVVANRDYAEIEHLIGFFINPVVMRSHIDNETTFIQLLSTISISTQDAYANHDIPFEQLVDSLKPPRDTSKSPLFQIAFDLRDPNITQSLSSNLSFSVMEADLDCAQYDLHLTLEQSNSEILAYWEYNTDLFSALTIERMAENYLQLLSELVAEPKHTISLVNLLSSSEINLQQTWNKNNTSTSNQLCMHQLFETHVHQQPDAIAIVLCDTRLSYQQLNSRANCLAHYLLEQGCKKDEPVAIYLTPSIDMVICVLAILKSGGAYLGIDPAYPTDRISFMLDDSAVSLILTTDTLGKSLPPSKAQAIFIDNNTKISQYPSVNPDLASTPDNLAYLIYTSGSTGTPKGVMVEHHGWTNVAQAQIDCFDLRPGMRILQFASLSFDASAFELSMAWGSGGTLYLGNKESLLPGQNLANMLKTNSIEIVTLPPTALAALPDVILPELKVITVAGEACPEALVKRWNRHGTRFFNLYGPTETTIWASYAECFSNNRGAPAIGKPVPNMQLYVVDKNMKQLPIGMPGELCIGGEGVTRGYLNRPSLNSEKFIKNCFSPTSSSQLFRSGDLVRFLSDGNLEFLGRIDHQVKIRGFRVELGEIESLLRKLPGVAEVIVVAQSSQNEQQLIVYVSTKKDISLTQEATREYLTQALPNYMIPSHIFIIEKMPLTHNGKVDRNALPSLESLIHHPVQMENIAQSDMEKTVTEIWKQVLFLEMIDVHHNFFDLGGHSLKIAQVQTLLCKATGIEVPLVKLFQYATIKTLANHLDSLSAPQEQTPEKTDTLQEQGSKKRSRLNKMAQLALRKKSPRSTK